jgi:hypothetical protein
MGTLPIALYSALDLDVLEATGRPLSFYKDLIGPLPDFQYMDWCAYSLSHSIDKKFLPKDTRDQDKACLLKFRLSNTHSGSWLDRSNTSLDEELMGTFKQCLYEFFEPSGVPLVGSLDDIFLAGRCGPGASLMATGGDFYSKMFSSRLTSTSRLLVDHYRHNVRRWPEWSAGDLTRAATYGEPCVVEGSKLSFVPKNERISRSICTEPTLNMFYQLGLGEIITSRLGSYFGIDLGTQPDVNRVMARAGSETGTWSSIDLESASDTISLLMVRAMLPRSIVSYLEILRSPTTSVMGERVQLDMISSMGNGFTFPLQTAIFAAVVKAAYMSVGLPLLKGDYVNFGVFGDDLIIDRRARWRVERLLSLLGFIMNADKSFFEGPFRESCGCDYLFGKNIRGCYIRSLDTLQDSYAAINMLNEFSARTGFRVSWLMTYLLGRVDRSVEIPAWEDPSSGIKMPLRFVKTKRVSVGKTKAARTAARRAEETQSVLYQKYVNEAVFTRIGDGFIADPRDKRGKRRIYNPSGLLIAFLSGMALSSGLPIRIASGEVQWRKKWASCSYWDSLPFDAALQGGFDWQQWYTAVHENFRF